MFKMEKPKDDENLEGKKFTVRPGKKGAIAPKKDGKNEKPPTKEKGKPSVDLKENNPKT